MGEIKVDAGIISEFIIAIPYLISMVHLIINFTINRRIKSQRTAYIAGVAILYVAAIYNLLVNAYSPKADFTPYIVSISTFIICVFLINKDNFKRKLLIFLWLILPTLFIEIFIELWLYFFVTKDIDSLMADPIANVYTRMFSSTFTICVNVCVVLFLHRKKTKKTWISIVFLSLFPIVQAMYLTLILVSDKAQNLKSVIIANTAFDLLFTIMYFLYVYFINATNRVYKREQEEILLSELHEKDKQYYDMVQDDIRRIRFIRHDIRNYIEQLQFLINENSDSARTTANSLISQIDMELSNYSSENYCEHPTANMVLTLAHKKALKQNINLSIVAEVPSEIKISEIDISSAISNMTDNAIRATTASCNNVTEPSISVVLKNDFLIIKTINPTSDTRIINSIDELKTTKSDISSHGLGLKILKEIAQKYSGLLTVKIENQSCTFTLFLKNS